MRRRTPLIVLAIFTCGCLAPVATLADSIREAKPGDIGVLLDAASGENSAYRASLIGETPGRVYIEYLTAVHASSLFSKQPKRVVYWLPRARITDEQLAQFRARKEKLQALDGLKAPDAK